MKVGFSSGVTSLLQRTSLYSDGEGDKSENVSREKIKMSNRRLCIESLHDSILPYSRRFTDPARFARYPPTVLNIFPVSCHNTCSSSESCFSSSKPAQ